MLDVLTPYAILLLSVVLLHNIHVHIAYYRKAAGR
jgi:hypothetical protein